MILSTIARLHHIEPKAIHPKFEHFDRAVTVLVFFDLAHRISEVLHGIVWFFTPLLILVHR